MEIICDCGKHIAEKKEEKDGSILFFCKFCKAIYRITKGVKK